MDYQKELEFAKSMAHDAGLVMKKYYRAEQKVIYKDEHGRSPVTIADTEINEHLIKEVNKNFPSHGVRGEEASQNLDAPQLWVVDPIDGTRMYNHHIPTSMFSLAFVVEGEVKVAVCYNPWTDDLYSAVRGRGAFRNNDSIKVQDTAYDNTSVGIWVNDPNKIKALWEKKITPIIMYPMVAKGCLVAEGSISGMISQPGMGTHDVAATSLLVEEAGGIATDINGNFQQYNKDVNGSIMGRKDILEIVKDIA